MTSIISTAEFWVAVAFLICVLISVRLVLPNLSQGIENYQQAVQQTFKDAETKLTYAKKKLKLAQAEAEALQDATADLKKDSSGRIRRYKREWEKQRTHIQSYYYSLQQYRIQALDTQLKQTIVAKTSAACAEGLRQQFILRIDEKVNTMLVDQAINKVSNM